MWLLYLRFAKDDLIYTSFSDHPSKEHTYRFLRAARMIQAFKLMDFSVFYADGRIHKEDEQAHAEEKILNLTGFLIDNGIKPEVLGPPAEAS